MVDPSVRTTLMIMFEGGGGTSNAIENVAVLKYV